MEEASKKLDEIGIDRPIKDELEFDEFMPKDQDVEQDVTSEEESELGGLARPKWGRGWLGVGPILLPLRKVFPNLSPKGPNFIRQDVGRLTDADFRITTWPRN